MKALILMTRIPIPGQTKTRLMDIMSGLECAGLHTAFLCDLMVTFQELEDEIDIYITYTPDHSYDVLNPIIPSDYKSFPQYGDDLGARMFHALRDILAKGYEKVILIGSDIPDLKAVDLRHAFTLLDKADIALGPTYDGGYYLVGMKTPHDTIFKINKKWGGKSVLESTIDRANNLGLSIGLAAKYRDIDTKDDLFEFIKTQELNNPPLAVHTLEFIKEWQNNKWSKTN